MFDRQHYIVDSQDLFFLATTELVVEEKHNIQGIVNLWQ